MDQIERGIELTRRVFVEYFRGLEKIRLVRELVEKYGCICRGIGLSWNMKSCTFRG